MSKDTETPSNFLANLQDVLLQAGQIIDIRLALLIGLIAFFIAVGFDSSGNQAEAADLLRQKPLSAPTVTVSERSMANARANLTISGAQSTEGGANTPGLSAAQRLRHGTLTSAMMTSSRLTQAHFFTDLPSSP